MIMKKIVRLWTTAIVLFCGITCTQAQIMKSADLEKYAKQRYGDKWIGNGNAGYYATGQILGTYNFPSMEDQLKGVKGSIGETDNMPYMLIFQHGQFENAVNIYNNMSSSFGVSIRPVVK